MSNRVTLRTSAILDGVTGIVSVPTIIPANRRPSAFWNRQSDVGRSWERVGKYLDVAIQEYEVTLHHPKNVPSQETWLKAMTTCVKTAVRMLKTDTEVSLTRRVTQVRHYSGPIPPAEEFARYEKVYPGSADRLFSMAEREQE